MSDQPGPDSGGDEPELLGGPVLSADGTVEGRAVPEVTAPPVAGPAQPEAPLELARKPLPRGYVAPTAYRPERAPSRRWVPVMLIGLVVAGLGIAIAGMLLKPASPPRVPTLELPSALRDALPELSGPPVIITSEPPGATIRSAAGELGKTPWAGNNPFLLDTELTLSLSGFQPRKVTLKGASEAQLNVTLKKVTR